MFLLGIFATAFALIVRYLDRTLLQIGYSITGMLIGPLTGIFVLGMMLPWASTKVTIGKDTLSHQRNVAPILATLMIERLTKHVS